MPQLSLIALIVGCASTSPTPARTSTITTEDAMNTTQRTPKQDGSAVDRDTLVARLKQAGELEVSGADQAEVDSYSS